MGKAGLASDVGGLRELIDDGETGMLFRAGDVAEMTDRLLRLATNRPLRDRLARQGQAKVRSEREWTTIAARYEDIYRRAGVRRTPAAFVAAL
jgi:glycogen(starch) synthase